MIKKIIIFLFLINLINSINLISFAFASTSTQSPTSTSSAKPASSSASKVQDLLNRVADKVTAITEKMQRTYHGTVKSNSRSTLVVTTPDGDKNIVTNDATDFFRIRAGSQTSIDLKGIKVGDDIAAIGTIDPQTTDMTAKQVIAKIHRYNYSGTITSVDKGIATITLPDNSAVKVDLTSALALKKIVAGKIVTAKLADFTVNSTIFIIAYSPDPKTGIYSSLKALVWTK